MTLSQKLRIAATITIRSMRRYQKRAILLSAVAVIGVICLFEIGALLFFHPNHRFVEGLIGEYKAGNLPSVISELTSTGLTKIAADGTATPSAAQSWEVSEDGKTYTFTLNPTMHWQDRNHSPLSAHDLTDLFDPTGDVKTTVLNTNQIQFQLKKPYSPFPVLLAKPLYRQNDADKSNKNFIGLGHWQITKTDQSGGFVTAVELTDTTHPSNTLTFRFYPSADDLVTAYKLGELSAISGVLPTNLLDSWNNYAYYQKIDHGNQVTLFFNVRDGVFADKAVRQALSYAIQKDSLPGDAAFSPIPPTSWAFNPDIKQYVFDTNHAKDLLKKAGSAITQPITLTATPQTVAVANQIATSWKTLGLTVTVNQVTDIPKNFQAMVLLQEVSPDPDQYALWHSLQKDTNISGYSQIRVDKLLEDGRTTSDSAVRKSKYADFQRFLVEDDPALFLYYPYQSLYINKRFDQPFYRQLNNF